MGVVDGWLVEVINLVVVRDVFDFRLVFREL